MDVVEILEYVMMPIICLICSLGNGLVIMSVARFPYLNNTTNSFVVLLAAYDLLLGIPGHVTYQIAYLLNKYQPMSKAYVISCQVYVTVVFFGAVGNVVSILFITMERYLYIHYPLKYSLVLTKKRAIYTCISTSGLTFIFCLLSVFTKEFNSGEYCMLMTVVNENFLFYGGIPLLCVTALAITVTYTRTAYVACRASRTAFNIEMDYQRNTRKSQIRITKVMFLVISVFLVTHFIYGIAIFVTKDTTGLTKFRIETIVTGIFEVLTLFIIKCSFYNSVI